MTDCKRRAERSTRALVDCIDIGQVYDASVLNVELADVPERKAAGANGRYELSAPTDETSVAAKIVVMHGNEIVVIAGVQYNPAPAYGDPFKRRLADRACHDVILLASVRNPFAFSRAVVNNWANQGTWYGVGN